ncbi:NifX-associated nitrogen fixation protein [Neorhizobium huautlense]|uniref:NifX-associated nitrogen fixation protein n=1 Tax=Neorhizobium huautlense TaxID=67774 RepID=UPI000CFA3B01|nr:NifX-associated nitrogen fixation protein [Neorhizobium huautlense]
MKEVLTTGDTSAVNEHEAVLATPFVRCLTRLIRAQDTYGWQDGASDTELLAKFIVTEEQRRQIPIIGDPRSGHDVGLNIFYTAGGLTIETRTGLVTTPTIMISDKGFGKVLLTTGRLVVFSKTVRDVHRFGFATLPKLAEAGAKLVNDAIAAIEAYPDVARA